MRTGLGVTGLAAVNCGNWDHGRAAGDVGLVILLVQVGPGPRVRGGMHVRLRRRGGLTHGTTGGARQATAFGLGVGLFMLDFMLTGRLWLLVYQSVREREKEREGEIDP